MPYSKAHKLGLYEGLQRQHMEVFAYHESDELDVLEALFVHILQSQLFATR